MKYNDARVAQFLAFTTGPKAPLIDTDFLNNISLQDNADGEMSFFQDKIQDIFVTEIQRSSVKDGENIGVLLSGGLDSTLLLHFLQKLYPNSTLYTYTLGYTPEDAHLQISAQISAKYGAVHREVIYDISSRLLETFDDIYAAGYDLEGEDSLIMNHILAPYVQQDCQHVFSGFGLDYVFAGMDLFRNSFMEKLYRQRKIDKKYMLAQLGENPYYLKYVLDKIDSPLGSDFFPKYGEFYGDHLKASLKNDMIAWFHDSMGSLRSDISSLKRQIYFIISTSLSNRYNPYNRPYEMLRVQHHNPFGSRQVVQDVLALNIPDQFLYDVASGEKKHIIREMARSLVPSDLLEKLHSGTVLKYGDACMQNKAALIEIIGENRSLLENYFSAEYLDSISEQIDQCVWYETAKQMTILLQLIYYCKHQSLEAFSEEKISSQAGNHFASLGLVAA